MRQKIVQEIDLRFDYPVYFTRNTFSADNPVLFEAISRREPDHRHRFVLVIDDNVARAHPRLESAIADYVRVHAGSLECAASLSVPGGEVAKNRPELVHHLQEKIYRLGLCRQSLVIAIGGGAVLDMVGFAVSTPHRGLRLIRMPTTVMAQGDSGVGVKNSLNGFSRKNFLGTFAPPFAVIDDFDFLATLSQRDWMAGVAEAVKVGLLKDADFVDYLSRNAPSLLARDSATMEEVIYRCAELHLAHIRSSGDPFEMGHSRPLDFGHWAAHKLESLSDYRLRHGEAVAAGIALDTRYSAAAGLLAEDTCRYILQLLKKLGFSLYYPEMEQPQFAEGLSEFREHLGGVLCISLLCRIGRAIEVHEMDLALIGQATAYLKHASDQAYL